MVTFHLPRRGNPYVYWNGGNYDWRKPRPSWLNLTTGCFDPSEEAGGDQGGEVEVKNEEDGVEVENEEGGVRQGLKREVRDVESAEDDPSTRPKNPSTAREGQRQSATISHVLEVGLSFQLLVRPGEEAMKPDDLVAKVDAVVDESEVDKGAVDKGAVDKGVVDKGAVDKGVVDKGAVDESAADEKKSRPARQKQVVVFICRG
ncbi:hypothetical protein FA15DRAFT_758734 [Coprinopsis marcescibilis]|uniref:Uncharacterized protein n=1 Tax=Coprinopsis marcescibilis TaxID=230819 RepID=A0A5C3KZM9_COPMA|nr:hypothetical protein FA15DRAFT_758734 [Coprinopsis marcescibilis]